MRKSDLSLMPRGEAAWIIPASMNKAGREHVVPLSGLAVDIIESRLARTASEAAAADRAKTEQRCPYVLSTDSNKPLSSFSKAKIAVENAVASMNKSLPESERVIVSDWQLHDLRRAAATGMVRFGADRFVVARVLNHADTAVTGRYDLHAYADEKRRALQGWADGLQRILEPPTANVVPLRVQVGG
jgi:integrase